MDARPQTPASSRDEKLGAIAALLGPETLARLRARGLPAHVPDQAAPASVAPDRLAWHQNRLLQRLRDRLDQAPPAPPGPSPDRPTPDPDPVAEAPGDAPIAAAAAPRPQGGIDARIASALDPMRLADEHPAVLAHILRGMDRSSRVATLHALPGSVARAAIQRLRNGLPVR
ncbi:hypothetical protein roselon_01338 [Roseibacterium elongatum DSM 19469]|uniref:Uncharacterized protein n=1 Tax=Roseicyclus elongatus DSM 19469 TaxID=1294273 RepID=W8S4J4_9RHOB|nr:hypothetical protein [Roseibacterium elongatum]AHM03726.1 hypothetical protein roselon_01338 [Roseibacterium elongatum DSM 19469]